MKVTVHKQSNGGVSISRPTPEFITLLTGNGMNMPPDVIAKQIENLLIPGTNGRVVTRELATEWVNAVSSGGLTESEIYDLLTRRAQMQQGYIDSATVDEAVLTYHTVGCTEHSTDFDMCEHVDCQNRYFRDAVVWDDAEPSKCRCDMPAARLLHMDKIRAVRNAELVKEDVTFMRAVEVEDTDAQATIKTKKQVLRDIPATFDITTDVDTPEKLKAKWPAELPARE
jgi:hypothetical protein